MNNHIENSVAIGSICELPNGSEPYTCTSAQSGDMDILLELSSIGAGHAATSLSEVLQQQVLIEHPKIHRIPPHMLPKYYGRHDTPTTAVYMQLANLECDILLMLELAEAKRIAAIMNMSTIEELDPAMEESAIQELANIIIGSFLTAISDFIGVRLMPTTPQHIVDTFDSIMDNFLVKQSLMSNEALIFDINFKRQDDSGKHLLMLFPSPQLQALLIDKSKEMMS